MKKFKKGIFLFLLIVAMLISFTGCGLVQNQSTKPSDKELTEDRVVWITTSGSKFHDNKDCSNMKKPQETTVKEAREKNYEPCKKCFDVDE